MSAIARAHSCIRRFGRVGGVPLLYFHGSPGAALEAELIATAASRHGVELWAIDRAKLAITGRSDDYLSRLAKLVSHLQAGRLLPIVGFSIGAALALRVAARLGRDAGPLFLLSAGGPLDLPGAFDGMGAGARMFKLAQANGSGFALAVAVQAVLARRAPALLQRLLFAGASLSDGAFAASVAGRAQLTQILAQAWAGDAQAYRQDVLAYVAPWSAELDAVRVPVSLWHGSEDNWAPIAMAHALAERLGSVDLHIGSEGHYTSLITQAPAALLAAAAWHRGHQAP